PRAGKADLLELRPRRPHPRREEAPTMRGKRIALIVVLALAGLTVAFRVFRDPPAGVRVARVTRGSVEHLVTSVSSGTLKAKRSLPMSTAVGGRVLEILKREGDPVAEGEPVVVLDSEEL